MNWGSVEVANENVNNGGSVSQFVQPGFQKLTINSVEDVVSQKGNKGFKIAFESDKGGTFNQSFWVADQNDNMLGSAPSFQYLVDKFSGSPLVQGDNTASISAKLIGKSHDVTVDGRKYTTEKDGKKYNNTAAQLRFAGWSGESQIRYTGEWDTSSVESVAASSKEDDLPF